jgi:hypothetical protein
VVSTLPSGESNRALLHALRACGYTGKVAVAVRDETQSAALTAAGIDRVFNLFDDAAEQATHKMCEALLQVHDVSATPNASAQEPS